MPVILRSGFSAGYQTQVLAIGEDDVSLDKPVSGLVGPNGAGKSTVLKAISGHVQHAGDIWFDGLRLRSGRPWERLGRGIAYLAQDMTGFGNLSAADCIRLTAIQTGRAEKTIREHVQNWLDGAAADLSKPVRLMSGGGRKRLNIALMLSGEPKVMLLDEPTAGLDAGGVMRLVECLKERIGLGAQVVLVEQAIEFVKSLCGDQSGVVYGVVQGRVCHRREVKGDEGWEEVQLCSRGVCW